MKWSCGSIFCLEEVGVSHSQGNQILYTKRQGYQFLGLIYMKIQKHHQQSISTFFLKFRVDFCQRSFIATEKNSHHFPLKRWISPIFLRNQKIYLIFPPVLLFLFFEYFLSALHMQKKSLFWPNVIWRPFSTHFCLISFSWFGQRAEKRCTGQKSRE